MIGLHFLSCQVLSLRPNTPNLSPKIIIAGFGNFSSLLIKEISNSINHTHRRFNHFNGSLSGLFKSCCRQFNG